MKRVVDGQGHGVGFSDRCKALFRYLPLTYGVHLRSKAESGETTGWKILPQTHQYFFFFSTTTPMMRYCVFLLSSMSSYLAFKGCSTLFLPYFFSCLRKNGLSQLLYKKVNPLWREGQRNRQTASSSSYHLHNP